MTAVNHGIATSNQFRSAIMYRRYNPGDASLVMAAVLKWKFKLL